MGDVKDVYSNIDNFNPNKKRKMLVVFNDITVDMFSNKNVRVICYIIIYQNKKTKLSTVFIRQNDTLLFQIVLG